MCWAFLHTICGCTLPHKALGVTPLAASSRLWLQVHNHDGHVVSDNPLSCPWIFADDGIQHFNSDFCWSFWIYAFVNTLNRLVVCEAIPNTIASQNKEFILGIQCHSISTPGVNKQPNQQGQEHEHQGANTRIRFGILGPRKNLKHTRKCTGKLVPLLQARVCTRSHMQSQQWLWVLSIKSCYLAREVRSSLLRIYMV